MTIKCATCGLPQTQIGYYQFTETTAQSGFDEEGEPLCKDVSYTQYTHVWRCPAGHTDLYDWVGFGLEIGHKIEKGFIRTAPDPKPAVEGKAE